MGAIGRRVRRGPTPARELDAALALRQILNPLRREAIVGMARRQMVVSAVWPDEHGFLARLETVRRPGVPAAWARWRDGIEVWHFPDDPELSALSDLVGRGYEVLGHRLGRSAALRSPDEPAHVLHLRPAAIAEATFRRWTATHAALRDAGVMVPRLGPLEPGVHGLRAEWIAAELNGHPVGEARMTALGRVAARAHAVMPPMELSPRGLGFALDATVRQLAMATHSGTSFTQWLERRLDRWRLLGTAPCRSADWLVHGSFHFRHVLWAGEPVIVGWDLAGRGDPEEDLAEMAARLYWESGPEAAARFAAFRRGYAVGGGSVNQELFEHYARLAMIRVLALHALREPDQARLRSGQEQWAAWPEVVRAW